MIYLCFELVCWSFTCTIDLSCNPLIFLNMHHAFGPSCLPILAQPKGTFSHVLLCLSSIWCFLDNVCNALYSHRAFWLVSFESPSHKHVLLGPFQWFGITFYVISVHVSCSHACTYHSFDALKGLCFMPHKCVIVYAIMLRPLGCHLSGFLGSF